MWTSPLHPTLFFVLRKVGLLYWERNRTSCLCPSCDRPVDFTCQKCVGDTNLIICLLFYRGVIMFVIHEHTDKLITLKSSRHTSHTSNIRNLFTHNYKRI